MQVILTVFISWLITIVVLVAATALSSIYAVNVRVSISANSYGKHPAWETAIEILALHMKEEGFNAVAIPGSACLDEGYPKDSPNCFYKTFNELNSYGTFELAVPVPLTIAGQLPSLLRRYPIVDMGDVAPPVHRACLTTRGPLETISGLTNITISKQYQLSDYDMENIFHDVFNINYDRSCNTTICMNNTFTPKRCSNIECATILTSDITEMAVLAQVIDQLELFATVISLGNQLPETIKNLSTNAIIFCDFAPELTIDLRNYFYLPPPVCDLRNLEKISDFERDGNIMSLEITHKFDYCPFEIKRLAKFVNLHSEIKEVRGARTLKAFTLDTDELRDIYELRIVKGVHNAAKEWYQSHPEKAAIWRGTHEQVTIVTLIPLSGYKEAYDGLSLRSAAVLAEHHINEHSNYSYKLDIKDDSCSTADSFTEVIRSLESKEYGGVSAFAGPACLAPLTNIAAITHIINMPLLAFTPQTPGAGGTTLSDQLNEAHNLLLAAGDSRWFGEAVGAFLKHFNWQRVAVLSETSTKHTVNTGNLKAEMTAREISDDASTVDLNLIAQWVSEASTKRIWYLNVEDGRVARAALCLGGRVARKGAVWIVPSTLIPSWITRSVKDTHPCSQEEIDRLAQGHFRVGPSWTNSWGEDKVGKTWRENWHNECKKRSRKNSNCIEPTPDSALLYDVLRLWGNSLDSLLQTNASACDNLHDPKVTEYLINHATTENFTGLTGPFTWMEVDGVKVRRTPIDITQWIGGNLTRIAIWDNGTFEMIGNITWQTEEGDIPDDGREKCDIQGLANFLNTGCRNAFIFMGIILFVLFAGIMIAIGFYCKKRMEQRYKEKLKYACEELKLLPSKALNLDKWEIPRERVVINRKIGMGAFGTVYGGHAILAEDKPFAPVAVKTLKPGASTEEKLDFLSEAEAMKRFDHKNVVRLLGVVTQTEPVCTVMEFMLYGDLKSYLLSRRHLANCMERDTVDEVSPKRLTSMALDVARALAYLAELKYVHRDVAARNCLVGNNRTVKLADFGMTRLVFDSDYYRLSRRGLLPVRWMAPESLTLGVFSQGSDVWSFGVLLYEIVTFGSLPFQGLSNKDVLSRVKQGKTLDLPSGLKPQLEGLMNSCWQQSPKNRPEACEVAAFLADSPRLLNPVLDIPMESLFFQNHLNSNGRTHREIAEERWASWAAPNSTATETTYVTDLQHSPDCSELERMLA